MRYPLVLTAPCPKCGKRPWTNFLRDYGHYIYCPNDHYTTDYYEDIHHAMLEWLSYAKTIVN